MPDASDIRLSFTIDGEEGIFFRLACNYDEGVEGAEYHLVNCDTVIDELSKAQSPSDVSRAVRLLAELDFEHAVDDDEAQRQIDEFDTFLERIAHIPSIAR
ncbi:MAG: hypothetical protein IKD70_06855, partial [Eggerthellaceae bacterium]|nr:hypothetical protein [Eggerthellaceae bacterium]